MVEIIYIYIYFQLLIPLYIFFSILKFKFVLINISLGSLGNKSAKEYLNVSHILVTQTLRYKTQSIGKYLSTFPYIHWYLFMYTKVKIYAKVLQTDVDKISYYQSDEIFILKQSSSK